MMKNSILQLPNKITYFLHSFTVFAWENQKNTINKRKEFFFLKENENIKVINP